MLRRPVEFKLSPHRSKAAGNAGPVCSVRAVRATFGPALRAASPAGASGAGGRRLTTGRPAELFVEAQGFLELVFEDDDAAGGVDGGALVDEVAGAHRDPQLAAGEAAVAALGAQGGDEALFVEGA